MVSRTKHPADILHNDGTAPASRATWSGQLHVGKIIVPIKAHAATVSTTSSLRQLHSDCGQRIELRKWCPLHGHVTTDAITKAFDYAPDRLVELSAEELMQIEPKDDKTIRLQRFLSPERFDLTLLCGRSLYLVPASAAAAQDYAVIQQALSSNNAWGVGRMVLSGAGRLVAVRAVETSLIMYVLHWPKLQRACPAMDIPSPLSTSRLRATERFIRSHNGAIPWEQYLDDREERLMNLVRDKVARQNGRTSSGAKRSKTRKRTTKRVRRTAKAA